ncbi:hypothetical protein [Roseovarius sp. D22-M7]|uniref:hypothetical protein n=1 Tax=Roseovarius sp. D22-M7 TaxID=3127116 RepID=UPI00300FAE35
MSDIDALQARITAALDRIAKGLEARADAPDPEAVRALAQQFDEAQAANARLAAEVAALQETVQARDSALAAAEEARGETLTRLDADLQALRAANQQLRDSNRALREAHAAGIPEPQLIDTALQAEIDGLRATRAADRAEVEAVLAELARVIAGAGTADTTTEEA